MDQLHLSVFMQTRFKKPVLRGVMMGVLIASTLAIPAVSAGNMYVVADHLNVRVAGKYGTHVLAIIDGGDKVSVLHDLSNGWKKVSLTDGRVGYVNGFYLTDRVPPETVVRQVHTVSADSVYLHSDKLSKTRILSKGDALHIMSDRVFAGNWLWVKVLDSISKRYDGQTWFIAKKFVEPDKDWIADGLVTMIPEWGWISDVPIGSWTLSFSR